MAFSPREFQPKIAVVGLGYVGLPLLVEFGKAHGEAVIGFDVSKKRIETLREGIDTNNDVPKEDLAEANTLFSDDPNILKLANFIIVAVPTPLGKANQPDLAIIRAACKTIGENIQPGTVVVFESTVYPGVTEEVCIPIIDEVSGLIHGRDWKAGYSPERINPGDTEHTIERIIKIVSGCDEEALEIISDVYLRVCKAGVHKAPTIQTAEAAKVIENIQRDLNIALMNELSIIFGKLGINTRDVLDAAGTKWNFHKYRPGLVGGHCIGVDPYYLTYRAQEVGYHPEVILAGRRINDFMANHVAGRMVRGLIENGKRVQGAKVLVMGLSFKENIKDTRNSKILKSIQELSSYGVEVHGWDPHLSREEIEKFELTYTPHLGPVCARMDGIIVATFHDAFKGLSLDDLSACLDLGAENKGVIVDVSGGMRKEAERHAKETFVYECL